MNAKSRALSLVNRFAGIAGYNLRPIRGLQQRICGWELLATDGASKQGEAGDTRVGHRSGIVVSSTEGGLPLAWFVESPGDLIQSEHLRGKFYEREELDLIKSMYRGGTFVDIGANVGNHAIFAARNLGAPKVICFEPNPPAFEILKLNFKLNDLASRLDLRSVGLSDREESLSHHASAHNLGDGRFDAQARGGTTLQVKVGDTELAAVEPGFIKIDVEGMELRVLAGLRQTIGRTKPPMFIEVDQENDARFLEFVSVIGYRVVQTCRRYSANCNYAIEAR